MMRLVLILPDIVIGWRPVSTLPILVPIMAGLGYDPIRFGVVFAMNMQTSYLTPPFGAVAPHLKGTVPPEIVISDVKRTSLPVIDAPRLPWAVPP